jgi:superoxide reductase
LGKSHNKVFSIERRIIMSDRRNFLRKSALITAGVILATGKKVFASESGFPPGVIYTRENPGMWAQKVEIHAPRVQVEGRKVTIQTLHPMTEKHYIVRHTLVTLDGKVLGSKTFYPVDKKAVSHYEVEPGHGTRFYATSFCNLHDFWVTPFTL